MAATESMASSKEAAAAASSTAKRKIDDISNGNSEDDNGIPMLPGASRETTSRIPENDFPVPDVTNGDLPIEAVSLESAASAEADLTAPTGGARPKIRRPAESVPGPTAVLENGSGLYHDQIAPQNVTRDCDAENLAILNNRHDAIDDSPQYGNGRCNVGDDDSCSDFCVGADLPKSFYQMEEEDECSDSDTNAAVGTTGATGVSGAGQSNLSTEVAALIQSELMRPRLRIGAGNSNAADVRRRRRQPRRSGDAAAPSNAAAPAAAAAAAAGDALAASGTDDDFLEMDFEESDGDDEESDDSGDSGQGGDENVTETNEEDNNDDDTGSDVGAAGPEDEVEGAAASAGAVAAIPSQPPPMEAECGASPLERTRCESDEQRRQSPSSPARVPDQLPLGKGEKSKTESSSSSCASSAAAAATASVPAVTPVRDDLGGIMGCMVRSQSLNSPLVGNQARLAECCVVRGESDPVGERIRRHRRRHSGEQELRHGRGGRYPAPSAIDDTLLNMEICGAKLSQREALVFGVPGAVGVDNVRRALVRLQMESADSPSGYVTRAAVEKTMIWTELEACSRQVSQIGLSACGATAVINALLALDSSHTTATVAEQVKTRRRAEEAPLPAYLASRSSAGATHRDLMSALEDNHAVRCRFFHMFPRRRVDLSHWLANWIGKGAVPIATLNLQKGVKPGQTVPDAWHHQMVFGVGPNGVYLTNPLESVSEELVSTQLCSKSELLVRRSDVLYRFDPATCDLSELAELEDERWDEYNVLGQVINVLREAHGGKNSQNSNRVKTEHVLIPADYESGITLVMLDSNENVRELLECPELQLFSSSDAAAAASSSSSN